MPVITIQLGQCGNQLGCSFFQTLAQELGSGDYQVAGLEEWFRLADSSRQRYKARSVLIDMEPKVVQSVVQQAAHSKSWWRYAPDRQLCMQSGAGNNWAHGFHGYGPRVRDAALDIIRKEVEACDVLGGFFLLQSMAGGTGAGLGTYVAAALRDEFQSTHALNCCVWPYESGEVIVQVSDGIVLLENEALHRTAHRLYNLPRPSFQDMNHVAAKSLASLVLPSFHRPATGTLSLSPHNTSTSPSNNSAAGGGGRGVGGSGAAVDSRMKRQSSGVGVGVGATQETRGRDSAAVVDQRVLPHGTVGVHDTTPGPGRPVRLLSELLSHCTPHPAYRVLSLRSLPQVPAQSIDFTTFTWPAITKRLRQMMITGSSMEEGLDWGVALSPSTHTHTDTTHSPLATTPPHTQQHTPTAAHSSSAHTTPSPHGPRGALRTPGVSAEAAHRTRAVRADTGGRAVNKSVSSWVVLRGQNAGDVDVSSLFEERGLYASWSVDPLQVSWHTAKYARCAMAATQLAADQACVAPCRRMQERAYSMVASRAYVHQYEKFGLQQRDFEDCFAHTEDLIERYETL